MATDQPQLATVIRWRREALGLTKAEASRRANVSRGTWHELENGPRHTLQPRTFNAVAAALDWEPEQLREALQQPGLAAQHVGPGAGISANVVVDILERRRLARERAVPTGDAWNRSIDRQLNELRQMVLDLQDEVGMIYSTLEQFVRASEGRDDLAERPRGS